MGLKKLMKVHVQTRTGRSAFGERDARLGPYETMLRKYFRFTVESDGDTVEFRDEGPGKEAYERLVSRPDAKLLPHDSAIRVGDLAMQMAQLASGHFSPSDPEALSADAVEYGECNYHATFDRSALRLRAWRSVWKHHGTPVCRVDVYINGIGRDALADPFVHLSIIPAESDHGFPPSTTPDQTELKQAGKGASDTRVVYVREMDTSSQASTDRGIRFLVASLAFLASKGVLSCESLVCLDVSVIERASSFRIGRSSGAGPETLVAGPDGPESVLRRELSRKWITDERHAFRRLGEHMLVARARDLPPVAPRRISYEDRLDAETRGTSGGVGRKRQKQAEAQPGFGAMGGRTKKPHELYT
jgi:hypothetical protein